MKTLLRSGAAAVVATLMLAGTEMVAAYPRSGPAASLFFSTAFIVYLPLLFFLAWALSLTSPARGLDFWFPFLIGALRAAEPLAAAVTAGHFKLVGVVAAALIATLVVRRRLESATHAPPFLFGLTVGIVLPILMARAARGFANSSVGSPRAVALGALAGLLAFVLLRAFVARWPRVTPVFLLGPVVSLGLWSRPLAQSAIQEAPREASHPTRRPPDIVLVVLDTLRARALAGYGGPHDTMPALEQFARSATRFEHAWTNGSWTMPAHAALFSGLRVTRHGYDTGFAAAERSSPDSFLANRLRRAGYATAAVVANFGVFGGSQPLLRGFERVEVEPLRPFYFKPWLFDLVWRFPQAPWLRGPAAKYPSASIRAPSIVDRALSQWSRPETRPRFLFVNFMEAHEPWIPEPEDLGHFGPPGIASEREQSVAIDRYLKRRGPALNDVVILKARYEEALLGLDRSLARLLAGVTSDAGPAGTIVVVTADHGESLGEHVRFGHRNSVDEEVARIPLIIRAPDLAQGVSPVLVQLTDVFGYLAASGGLERDPDLDALPFGERRQVVIEHRPGPQGTLPASYPRGDVSALIEWPFKYVEGPVTAAALFDLSVDPGEHTNLFVGDSERSSSMRSRLRQISRPASLKSTRPDPATDEALRALGYVR